jgi:hypothetical protein
LLASSPSPEALQKWDRGSYLASLLWKTLCGKRKMNQWLNGEFEFELACEKLTFACSFLGAT